MLDVLGCFHAAEKLIPKGKRCVLTLIKKSDVVQQSSPLGVRGCFYFNSIVTNDLAGTFTVKAPFLYLASLKFSSFT